MRRYAVDFSLDGDIKYVSHQDTIRMFSRALARARLPVRYSQGFNPHPRVSLPLPRPVGVASDAERLIVELTEAVACNDLARRLQNQVPRGISIRGARVLDPAERCLPISVLYRLLLPAFDPAPLVRAVNRLLATDSAVVQRDTGQTSAPKPVDVRPFIDWIDVTADGLEMRLHVTGQGTARPAEVCAALGIQDEAILHRVRRIEITWQ